MSAIERGLYVWVGAADLAVEKFREIPVVQKVRDRSRRLGEKSVIERAREIEPKLRDQADQLQVRGEKVVKRLRTEAKQVRKQIQSFPEDARKQVDEVRGRIQKAVGRNGNGKAAATTKSETSKKVS